MPTSVRLDPATEETIRRLARATSRSKSDVIREAVAAYGRKTPRGHASRTVFQAVEAFLGSARGGAPDLSERTGEAFREAIERPGGRKRPSSSARRRTGE